MHDRNNTTGIAEGIPFQYYRHHLESCLLTPVLLQFRAFDTPGPAMRLSIALLALSAARLASHDVVVATPGSTLTANLISGDTTDSALLRRAETVAEDEERTFTDPLINKYLHLFQGWAKQKQTPEDLFMYLGLPEIMQKAYKSGKWKRLLNNHDYIMYRKYQKYLKLVETGGGRANTPPSLPKVA